jgi:hypothetical protein
MKNILLSVALLGLVSACTPELKHHYDGVEHDVTHYDASQLRPLTGLQYIAPTDKEVATHFYEKRCAYDADRKRVVTINGKADYIEYNTCYATPEAQHAPMRLEGR